MRWSLLLVPCAAFRALPARGRRPSLARASTATREDGLVFAPDDAATVVDARGVASLGMPRVARYMRDDDSARYVMWFQARDDSINEEVVPLSTGRVFRAESFDGRSWRALAGDEMNGAAILSTSEDWWTFDTAHVGLGDVLLSSNANVRAAFAAVWGVTSDEEKVFVSDSRRHRLHVFRVRTSKLLAQGLAD